MQYGLCNDGIDRNCGVCAYWAYANNRGEQSKEILMEIAVFGFIGIMLIIVASNQRRY